MSEDLQQKIQDAIANPKNLGALENADSIGTVGSPDCGDMLRMWVKFKEDADGRKVIDRATFQTFGCETAIAVASVATELIAGKTVDEALSMSGAELSAPLGALPPMKIHCAQLVEGALRSALAPETSASPAAKSPAPPADAPKPASGSTLIESFTAPPAGERKVKVVLKHPPAQE
jgi:nitrogen fixation protein NifU and related proteins